MEISKKIKKMKVNQKIKAKLKSNQKETGVEVGNGILGVKRDILISLIDLMILRKDSLIRNVFFFLCLMYYVFS
jgi:hypothetical protein